MYNHACTASSRAAMRARQSSASSSAVSLPETMSAAASAADNRFVSLMMAFSSMCGGPRADRLRSLPRNPRVRDHLAPFAHFRDDEFPEDFRRPARAIDRDPPEALFH